MRSETIVVGAVTDEVLLENSQVRSAPEASHADKEAALLALFTNSRAALAGTCRKHGVPEAQIDDLLQECWMHASKKLHQLQEVKAVAGWVRQILFHMAMKIRLKASRAPLQVIDAVAEAMVDQHEDVIDAAIHHEEADFVHDRLEHMCALDRETLTHFYLEEHTIKEIADDEHVPVGTVKRRLFTARHRFQDVCQGQAH